MSEIRLGIAGLGTVAQGVLKLLQDNAEPIDRRADTHIRVQRVASRTPKPEVDLLGGLFSNDLNDLLADDVDVVVELIGGEEPARTLIQDALAAGKSVVTANKAVIARYGNQLLPDAPLKFEAAVAGSIPIIAAVEQALVANKISQITGIINGTCNYILTAMEAEGASFDEALARAQALGYAEADPTFDIEGIDAAHKLTILCSLAFDCALNFDGVYVEGITHISASDIQFAKELGYTIKHVGIARQNPDGAVEARVHPGLIPVTDLLASVNDVTNAVKVVSDGAGETLFSGPGAGSTATASAVLADVVAFARGEQPVPRELQQIPFVAINEVTGCNYLRIPVRDEPGVFAEVANALSAEGISIEAAIQKHATRSADNVSIVLLTEPCTGVQLDRALASVSQLKQMAGSIVRIRVEN